MIIPAVRRLFPLLVTAALVLPIHAEEQANEKDDGLTRVIASQDLTVRRGEDKAAKEPGIHPKKINRKEKHKLDRFAMIRFDSEDFGKEVRAVGLQLTPVIFGDEKNKPMRFRVYGVNDRDEQDEKFKEKTYDPNAEDTIVDRRISTVINRRQVSILGSFSTEKGEQVLFTNKNLLAFVRGDTNATVTLVVVRETESGLNSTFAPRQSETPPTLVMKLNEKD
ncbi:MAG: hypothetical protein AAGB26_16185 [Planctomycetota bacterium]